MSNAPQSSKSIYGMWNGTEERPTVCDNSKVLDGFNVDFVDGKLVRRTGRQILLSPTKIRPVQVLFSSNGAAGNITDVTASLTDGDPGTAGITSIFGTASGALYVGFPFRVTGLNLQLSSFSTTVTSVLQVSLVNRIGLSQGWSGNITITDATSVGGGTLKQNGNVTWASSNFSSVPWEIGAENTFGVGTPTNIIIDYQNLYWIRLTCSTTLTGANLSEISGLFAGSDGLVLFSGAAGATEFTTRAGERIVVAVSDYPGRLVDNTAGVIPETRVFRYNLDRGDVTPLNLPAAGRYSTNSGAKTSTVTFNGWLLGTTTGGNIWKYDGASASMLEAMPGMDYQLGIVGAQGYLAKTPIGNYLEVYHNKLMVAGSPMEPLAFYASLPDNDITNIPPQATVGGPNVWPIVGVYGIPGRDGDYITGASVVNDRYVIFTASQTWVFDETSLKLANGDIGCIAPGSLQRIDQSVYFLSDQGVFLHDGVNPTLLSGPIEKTLKERVNWKAAAISAASAHYKKKGEYWLWLPINGEWQNQIAVVYNYLKGVWRVVGGWYPFDTTARRGTNYHNTSAAFQAKDVRGRQALLSIDDSGTLWQEDVGKDDNGFIYPAYAVLHQLSSYSRFLAMAATDAGEDYVKFREWYLNIMMDGSWIEGVALEDGERFDQELDRRLSNVATNSEVVQKQALVQNSVSANATQSQFNGAGSWPTTPNFAQPKKIKLSFGRNVTKMNPVLHWPGGKYLAGSYVNFQVAATGGVYDLQISAKAQPGGR